MGQKKYVIEYHPILIGAADAVMFGQRKNYVNIAGCRFQNAGALQPQKGRGGSKMEYHMINRDDCLFVATHKEKLRLGNISDMSLLKSLALRWCSKSGFTLGGYLGGWRWDATKAEGKT